MSRIYLSPPHMSGREFELLRDAFESNWIAPLGPHVDGFERELGQAIDVPHVAALSSGTAALHLALRLVGVRPGDEVLCSDLTFVATANAIAYLGAQPVFIDADPETWTLDPDLLDEELRERDRRGRRPRAILAVDLYGQTADYRRIEAIAERHGVPVVEDAAEALGATCAGRPAGGFGRVSAFSFNGNKILTTSGGGALASSDPELVEKARFLATQARDAAPHYEHSELGYNYRLSNLLAAVGRAQLEVLTDRVDARRRVFDHYRDHLGDLPGIEFMPEAPYGRATRWLTCLTVDADAFGADRDLVIEALGRQDIEARPVWKPMHLQPLWAGSQCRGGAVGERLFAHGLCLPSGSSLTASELDRIVAIVRSVSPHAPS